MNEGEERLHKTFFTLLWGCSAVFGALIVVRARQLSVRYFVWRAGLPTRSSQIDPPSTEPLPELKVKILMWILRYLGWLFFTVSMIVLFVVWITS